MQLKINFILNIFVKVVCMNAVICDLVFIYYLNAYLDVKHKTKVTQEHLNHSYLIIITLIRISRKIL